MQSPWHDNRLSPSVSISETKKKIKVEAELSGVDEKDINVSIDNGYLTVRGEKNQESRDEKAHRVECSYGFFERTLPLLEYAKPEEAKAKYKIRVLTIYIPKESKRKTAHSVPISVG